MPQATTAKAYRYRAFIHYGRGKQKYVGVFVTHEAAQDAIDAIRGNYKDCAGEVVIDHVYA